MTTHLHDSFSGSGTLTGHTPDTTFGGLSWTADALRTMAMVSGYAVGGPGNYGAITLGTAGTAYGVPGDLTLVFEFTPVTAYPGADYGLYIGLQTDTGPMRTFEWRYNGSNWELRIYDGTSTVLAVTGYTLGVAYVGTIVLDGYLATFTLNGHTISHSNAAGAWDRSAGLSRVDVKLKSDYKLNYLTVTTADTTVRAIGAAAAALGAPGVLGLFTPYAPPVALISAPAALGALRLALQHDFTALLGDATSVYVADLVTPGGAVRVPISSWQATLRADAASYVQCVVPACTPWVANINSATEMVISRRALLPNGTAVEAEMARAPLDMLQFDQGPQRHTCTLSGYGGAFTASADPSAGYDRTLSGLRSITSGNQMRVRCAVDWLLRPGQRAWAQGVPFVVGYINYYCPSGFDAYMDVGAA